MAAACINALADIAWRGATYAGGGALANPTLSKRFYAVIARYITMAGAVIATRPDKARSISGLGGHGSDTAAVPAPFARRAFLLFFHSASFNQ